MTVQLIQRINSSFTLPWVEEPFKHKVVDSFLPSVVFEALLQKFPPTKPLVSPRQRRVYDFKRAKHWLHEQPYWKIWFDIVTSQGWAQFLQTQVGCKAGKVHNYFFEDRAGFEHRPYKGLNRTITCILYFNAHRSADLLLRPKVKVGPKFRLKWSEVEVVGEVLPEPNRLLIIANSDHSWTGVRRVPGGVCRKSFHSFLKMEKEPHHQSK